MPSIRYDDKSYQIYGDLPNVGSSGPDIRLVNTDLNDVSLANFSGKRKILNIVISIDVETCAKSVVEFSRLAAEHEDIAVLTVSYDLPFAHRRLAEAENVENVHGLSAIRHAGFGENYGVMITEGPLAGMYARAVVVLDENNTVVHNELIEDVTKLPDYAAAFSALGVDVD